MPGTRTAVRWSTTSVVCLLTFLALDAPTAAQEPAPGHHREDATEIVLLGTVHFAGSLTDVAGAPERGILSRERQRELDAVAELLAEWGVDRFFVECSPDEQPAFDSEYRAYRSGDLELADPPGREGRGEIYQLGFRTAAEAGTGGVECADAEVFMPDAQAWEVAAEEKPELFERYRRYVDSLTSRKSVLAGRTVREAFVHLNTDSALYSKSYIYYRAQIGSFDGSGEKIRRESELAGRAFAVPFELAQRHMDQLREVIESVDGRMVDSVGPDADYVVLMDRQAAAAESGPGTGADTISVSALGDLVERTSTTWIGFPDHHIGADLVAQWFKRNLRIYANVAHAVEPADDRVVLLMGRAHIWSLRRYFRDNPDFRVVAVDEVL